MKQGRLHPRLASRWSDEDYDDIRKDDQLLAMAAVRDVLKKSFKIISSTDRRYHATFTVAAPKQLVERLLKEAFYHTIENDPETGPWLRMEVEGRSVSISRDSANPRQTVVSVGP
jgi:hypothetical protein